MGSTTISYTVLALALGLVCLLAGFFWGRSNLKSRVEQAIEEGHSALDAREFAMRQQLDEAIAEIARLRPLSEELGRVQDRLRIEQGKSERMAPDFDLTLNGGTGVEVAAQEIPPPPSQTAMTPESADEAIQKLLQSLETLGSSDVPPVIEVNEPAAPAAPDPAPASGPVATAEARLVVAPISAPEPLKSKAELPAMNIPRPKPPSHPEPAPIEARAPIPLQQAKIGEPVDEWQEFARSLAALTDRKK